jgi:hypothetical protein
MEYSVAQGNWFMKKPEVEFFLCQISFEKAHANAEKKMQPMLLLCSTLQLPDN